MSSFCVAAPVYPCTTVGGQPSEVRGPTSEVQGPKSEVRGPVGHADAGIAAQHTDAGSTSRSNRTPRAIDDARRRHAAS
jgi:hypothetical protein